MMHKILKGVGFLGALLIIGCSPISLPESNEYQLSAYSIKKYASKPHRITLLVTAPEAVAGYQTEQMLYINKPYTLEPFSKNAWSSPPADMLLPLLVKTLEQTGYFYAVASSPYNDESDYRLDTQLLNLEQNFLNRPSVIEFSAKIVLTRVSDNKVLSSQIINKRITCSQNTPYGGVIAANEATRQFTADVAEFVIRHVASKR